MIRLYLVLLGTILCGTIQAGEGCESEERVPLLSFSGRLDKLKGLYVGTVELTGKNFKSIKSVSDIMSNDSLEEICQNEELSLNENSVNDTLLPTLLIYFLFGQNQASKKAIKKRKATMRKCCPAFVKKLDEEFMGVAEEIKINQPKDEHKEDKCGQKLAQVFTNALNIRDQFPQNLSGAFAYAKSLRGQSIKSESEFENEDWKVIFPMLGILIGTGGDDKAYGLVKSHISDISENDFFQRLKNFLKGINNQEYPDDQEDSNDQEDSGGNNKPVVLEDSDDQVVGENPEAKDGSDVLKKQQKYTGESIGDKNKAVDIKAKNESVEKKEKSFSLRKYVNGKTVAVLAVVLGFAYYLWYK